MSKHVALAVNQSNLFQVLRNAFSSASVIGELMQNARRAGATWVALSYDGSTLSVQDNGRGMADLQNLLTAAQSGWDAKTQTEESPFGLGFLSSLYSCAEIIVQSRVPGAEHGQTIRSTTEHLLSGGSLVVEPVSMGEGTIIEMKQFTLESLSRFTDREQRVKQLEAMVASAAKGFAIHVHCNGHEVDRPDALGETFQTTDIGQIRFHMASDKHPKLYVQGLPIHTDRFQFEGASVVHLDASFRVKIPDRQHLLDPHGSERRVAQAMHALAKSQLAGLKQSKSPEDFLRTHAGDCQRWNCTDLLDDIPVALGEWFVDWTTADPGHSYSWEDIPTMEGVLTPKDIDERGVFLLSDEEFMKERCWLCASHHYTLTDHAMSLLGPEHWLMKVARSVRGKEEDEDPIEVVVNNVIGSQRVDLWDDSWQMDVVETLGLRHRDTGELLPTLAVPDHGTIYLARGAYAGGCTRLLSDFLVDDSYSEMAEDEARDALAAVHAQIIAQTPAHLLTIMARNGDIGGGHPRLAGKTFSVSFDEHGIMQAFTEL